MTDPWEDYYEILQVHPSAEPEVIKAAYRKLAQKYHPDRNPSSQANSYMKRLNLAYEVLSDPARRARYDKAYRTKKGTSSSNKSSGKGKETYSSNFTRPKAEARWYGFQNRGSRPNSSPWEGQKSRTYYTDSFYEGGIEIESRRGIFSQKTRGWELAGLLATMISSVFLLTLALSIKSSEFIAPFLTGLSLSSLSAYSAYKTNWLRDTGETSPVVKVITGFCVVLGWIWLSIAIFYAVMLTIFAIIVMIIGVLFVLGLISRLLFGGK